MSGHYMAVFSGSGAALPTEPPERTERTPFRCGRCHRMVWDGDGKWDVRNQRGDPAYGMPGQFMAVHRVSCNPVRRWWRRKL